MVFLFFFFNDTATTEIYTLSLHDALPICCALLTRQDMAEGKVPTTPTTGSVIAGIQCQEAVKLLHNLQTMAGDRKSTRLNSSHANISYAVFCLKKKKKNKITTHKKNASY